MNEQKVQNLAEEQADALQDKKDEVCATSGGCCGGDCANDCENCDCASDKGDCGTDCADACGEEHDASSDAADSEAKEDAGPKDSDVEQNRYVAAVSYLFFLCVLPFLFAKDSSFAIFHAKQGVVIAILWVIALMISSIPILGWLLGFFLLPFMTIVSIIGFVQAAQGKWYKMPIVSDWAEKF